MHESPTSSMGPASAECLRLVRFLGGGGFADTYLAEVLTPKLAEEWGAPTVAIKMPKDKEKEKILIKELLANNLVSEVMRDLAGAVNVVRYLGFEQYDGRYVMAMEYAAGGSLRDRIGRLGSRRPLELESSLRIMRGVLSGLSAIHSVGVFHRDIKPENILFDGEVPKIADLGIATMLHSHEQASSTVGTLAYMSPEILGPEGASFSADLWSAGVTLYEMLSGCWPFGDEHAPMGTMIDLIRNREPIAPHERVPGIPAHVSAVVVKALAKDPAARYATAQDMAVALTSGSELDEKFREIRSLLLSPQSYGLAESKLHDILRQYPRDSRSYRHLGELYNRAQRYTQAIEILRRGLQLNEKDAALHWDLGMAYIGLKQNQEAIRSIRQAISLGLSEQLERAAKVLLARLERGNV